MNYEVFKSDRYFTLFDINVSHGQLLIRSQKNGNAYNIDIVFFGTTYMQVNNRLSKISIKLIESKDNPIAYNTVKEYLTYKNSNLFQLESNGEVYYIIASFVRVFENELSFNETSLNHEEKGREKEIATSIISL
ncbi:hypothetical protein ACFOW1_01840 [Parasediminibacterium paludis]|uniref:Uncharacterized protein n=1 Tax=Parasediminibacterium paludis TaxID=908966 RepID=A0ABV8PSQ4_9BACT